MYKHKVLYNIGVGIGGGGLSGLSPPPSPPFFCKFLHTKDLCFACQDFLV